MNGIIQGEYGDDEDGRFKTEILITTNSCTNIKTYANLKYMNQMYLKNQFLMIRDSDGKDPDILETTLQMGLLDADPLEVTEKRPDPKYYSFENWLPEPKGYVKIKPSKTRGKFYEIFVWQMAESSHRLQSSRHLTEILRRTASSEDIRHMYMEQIKIYRGAIFLIFYGPL